MSNIKVNSTFGQMQNQHKNIVNILCNPYDQTKKTEMDFTILSLVSLHVIERNLHICRPPKKSTVIDLLCSLHCNLI